MDRLWLPTVNPGFGNPQNIQTSISYQAEIKNAIVFLFDIDVGDIVVDGLGSKSLMYRIITTCYTLYI